jgi:hypothetical protein
MRPSFCILSVWMSCSSLRVELGFHIALAVRLLHDVVAKSNGRCACSACAYEIWHSPFSLSCFKAEAGLDLVTAMVVNDMNNAFLVASTIATPPSAICGLSAPPFSAGVAVMITSINFRETGAVGINPSALGSAVTRIPGVHAGVEKFCFQVRATDRAGHRRLFCNAV